MRLLVGELEHVVEAVGRVAGGGAHGVDLLDVEAAVEDAELLEQSLEARLEQVMAPGRRRRRASAGASGASRTPGPGNGSLAVRRSRMTVGGRFPIRAAASSMPSGRSSRRAQISATTGSSAPGSQPGRTARARSVKIETAEPVTGPTVHLSLAGDVERRTTGDDEPAVGRRAHERSDLARRFEDMLHVVDDDDQGPVRDVSGQGAGGRPLWAVEHADAVGDGRRHLTRIVDGGEVDEPRAVREAVGQCARQPRWRGSTCRSRRVRSASRVGHPRGARPAPQAPRRGPRTT